ncbi:FIST C-terminal domain-containing protein [Flavobacteriaceae bacterium F89]|uniref:FIST C-terminal domain-containing protein n=1 Tax=Cerina litoralis TaxID=2874477 RepID=A0AAE3ETF0_9FLAO|nr:FIST N-terminal domain-containing protein [Cerina litoralis]MCG2459246.1 FIST C-terminal domain-containing protein [Cerina litoralis]
MKAKSIHGASISEIKTALEKSLVDGFSPTIAIVFISVHQDREAVRKLFKSKNIDVFGATSCGEFINGHQTEGEIAILLLELAKEHYTILFENMEDGNMDNAISKLAKSALKQFPNPSLIVCGPGINQKGEHFEGEKLVKSLEKQLGAEKLFFGGMAGDDWALKETFVFTNTKESNYGIVTLVLNGDKISLNGMAITGWKPMGIVRTVTKSEGKLLYEIDGKSAVELYLKYLGKSDKITEKDFKIFEDLAIEYPFLVERDTNETVIKSPTKIDHATNALVMDNPMPEGTKFWFTQPPEFDIVEEVIEKAAQLKTDLDTDADALLIFSCGGRKPILGPMVTDENEGLAELWDTPMAGFFSYGEFGRVLNGRQNFHGGSCCWVTLQENE